MAEMCKEHTSSECTHLCLDCGQLMCIECVFVHTNQHQVSLLPELATFVIQQLRRENDSSFQTATDIKQLKAAIKKRVADYWDDIKKNICTLVEDIKSDALLFVDSLLGTTQEGKWMKKRANTMLNGLLKQYKNKEYHAIYKQKAAARILGQMVGDNRGQKELLATLYDHIPTPPRNLTFLEGTLSQLESNLYSAVDSIFNANCGTYYENATLTLLYYPSHCCHIPLTTTIENSAIVQVRNYVYFVGGNKGKWDEEHSKDTLVYCLIPGSERALQKKASLTVARAWHALGCLLDRHLYVTGGYNNQLGTLASCEKYDVVGNVWRLLPSMQKGRWGHSLTILNDRRIYVFLGVFQKTLCTSIERFDILDECGGWTTVVRAEENMGNLRRCHASFQTSNTEILLFGGDSGPQLQQKCLVFSTTKNGIKLAPNEFSCRLHPTYTRILNRTHSNVIYKLAYGSQAATYNFVYKAWLVLELSPLKINK